EYRGRGAYRTDLNGMPGRPDFEAPTKDVHRGQPRTSPGWDPVASASPEMSVAGQRTTALGKQCQANVNRGGTPQQDSLGKRTGTPIFHEGDTGSIFNSGKTSVIAGRKSPCRSANWTMAVNPARHSGPRSDRSATARIGSTRLTSCGCRVRRRVNWLTT